MVSPQDEDDGEGDQKNVRLRRGWSLHQYKNKATQTSLGQAEGSSAGGFLHGRVNGKDMLLLRVEKVGSVCGLYQGCGAKIIYFRLQLRLHFSPYFGSGSSSSPMLPFKKMENFLVQQQTNCTCKVI